MSLQIIQFSTRWNVSEFAKFLSKDNNHVPSSFIISENFSPFCHKLIDAYIELKFNNFNEEQWSNISAYVHFKSYFKEPIPVSFKICFWNGDSRMAKGKTRSITLERCGRFGFENIINRKSMAKSGFLRKAADFAQWRIPKKYCSRFPCLCSLRLKKDLFVVCEVELQVEEPYNQNIFVGLELLPFKNEFVYKNFVCPPTKIDFFSSKFRLEPFFHFWKIKNFSKLIEKSQGTDMFIYSDNFKSKFQDKFCLVLWPNGQKNECNEVMIYLEHKQTIPDELLDYLKLLYYENKLNKKFEQIEFGVQKKSSLVKKDEHKKFKLLKEKAYKKSLQDEAELVENLFHYINVESVQWQIQILNDKGVPHGPHRFIYASNNIIGANHFSSLLLKHNLFIDEQTGKSILPNDTLNIKIEGHVVIKNAPFIIQNYICEKSETCFDISNIRTTDQFTHVWSIEHFSKIFGTNKHGTPLLVSSIFVYNEIKFHLVLLPNKNKGDQLKNYMSLFLRCENFPEEETLLQGKIFLINNKEEKTNIKLIFGKLENTVFNSGLLKFISHEKFSNSKENFLQNDKMTICFEGEILLRKDLSETERKNNLAIFDRKKPLPIEDYYKCKTCVSITDRKLGTISCLYTLYSQLNVAPNVIKFTHKWTINNYHKICKENVKSGKHLESLFSPEEGKHENLEFAVALHPFGYENVTKNSLSLLLHLKSFAKTKAIIQYRFSIVNHKKQKVFSNDKLNIFNVLENSTVFGFKEFITVGKLFKEKSELLPNNKLTLYLEGEIIMEEDISEANLYNYSQIFTHAKNPVIDCIETDNNTQIFEEDDETHFQWSKTSYGAPNFDQDPLYNYRKNVKIFFTVHNNNVNGCNFNNSMFNMNSNVNAEEINCINKTKEPKYKDEEKNQETKNEVPESKETI